MVEQLITSLEQAGEGSLALDIELMTLLGGARDVGDGVYYGPNTETWHTSEAAENEGYWMLPAPSRSLDAALALASRVLPYTTFRIDLDQRPRVWAFDKEDCFGTPSTIGSRVRDWEAYADAQTPALALCIAILRATNPKGQPNV